MTDEPLPPDPSPPSKPVPASPDVAPAPQPRKARRITGRRLLIFAVVSILVASTLVLAAGRYWGRGSNAEGVPTFVVAPGSSLAEVSEQLADAGLIASALEFRMFARVFGSDEPVKTGEYSIAEGEGYAAILDQLQSGKVIRTTLTIPEGLPSVLVHDRLMAAEQLSGEVAVPEEGSVLPASWDYRRGESRAAVLARMQQGMNAELERLWAARSASAPVSSPREAIILASIVEKETARPEERRRVAGVYANRLRQGMPLQADPTVIYPVTRGRPLGRRILRSELDDASNAYNTYARRGLPVGPIANPGRESIAAARDPEQHDFLYFVADGSGGHAFARTLAEHNSNVERWYAILRERGER